MKNLNQAVETMATAGTVGTNGVNGLVTVIKEKGVAHSQQEFTTLFNTLYTKTERFANNYIARKFPFVPLDRDTVLSYLMFEWLERVIHSFDEAKGDFQPFFFATLNRGILNSLQPQLTQRNGVNLQVVTIDLDTDDNGTTLLDFIPTPEEEPQFGETIEEALEQFKEKHGEQAHKVLMCLSFLEGDQRTEAICQVYGVPTYDATTRKKVERVKKHFASLIQ